MASRMNSEQWRELCKAQGGVWSMIIQLLQFAAKEHPEEFRRRRDGIGEALFSPELNGTKRSELNDNSSAADARDDEQVYMPSSWPQPGTVESGASASASRRSTVVSAEARAETRVEDRTVAKRQGPSLPSHVRQSRHEATLRQPEKNSFQRVEPPHSADTAVLASSLRHGSGLAEPSRRERLEESVLHSHRDVTDRSQRVLCSKDAEDSERIGHLEEGKDSTPSTLGDEGRQGGPTRESPRNTPDDAQLNHVSDFEAVLDELASEDMAMHRVTEIQNALANKETTLSELVSRLKELQHLPMSLEILRVTKVGRSVKAIAKKHPDVQELQELSRSLIREWKAMVEESCKEEPEGSHVMKAVEEESTAPVPVLDCGLAAGGLVGSLLPAPPLEDDVFQFTSLELSNCLTDLDSMGSELSGSVASAGGYCLATKTPESHRALPPSESSPCESNRPMTAGSTAAHPMSHPPSVLSESVRKTEFGGDAIVSAGNRQTTAVEKAGGKQDPKVPRMMSTTMLHKAGSDHRGGVPRHPGEHTNVLPKEPLQRGRDAAGQPQSASTSKPLQTGTIDKEQLELSKRKLQEWNHKLDEAKKARTIQVIDVEPKKAGSRPAQRHNGVSRGAPRFGQRL